MTEAERNYRLLQEIDANRQFLLLAMQSNPELILQMEEHVWQALAAVPPAPTFQHAGQADTRSGAP
jgi:hypothetical protein